MSYQTGRRESKFQADFISDLRDMGCICLKQDPTTGRQKGVPDYLVIYRSRWMFLEFKASAHSDFQPGQKEWIKRLGEWGFATVVYPENADVIYLTIERIIDDEDCKAKRKRIRPYHLGA